MKDVQIGSNYETQAVLRYIGEYKQQEIENYIVSVLNQGFISDYDIKAMLEGCLPQLTLTETEYLRTYTGISFRAINSLLRGYWSYDLSGKLTEEKKSESYALAEEIRKIIYKTTPISQNMKVYRGVSIASFYSYNISELKDLECLKGKYLVEKGFTSTSIVKENSFFYEPTKWGAKQNIEMECIIPQGSDDGIFLSSDFMSFSPNQTEYLIKSYSLFKVLDIKINKEENKATMKVILIPEKIWNPLDYERGKLGNSRK